MASIRSVEQADVAGKRVLCRVDFNVPLNEGKVTDDLRIRSALPTIQYLISQGARVILMSHLGRPDGTGYQAEFSLKPVADHLAGLLGAPVAFANDIIGPSAHEVVEGLADGQVALLENVRFDKREKKNDPEFCQELASLGEVFVNDAFGAAHRAHASTAGLAEILPSYAGYLMAKEVNTLKGMLDEPEHPFVAILGGSKVSDKIGVIKSLMNKADTIVVGGGMCFTFLLAQGKTIGTSLKEEELVQTASDLLAEAQEKGVKLLLPVDVVVADKFAADARTETVSVDAIPDDMMGLDIGPESVKLYAEAVAEAKTVFWNGPMGVFEMPAFEAGTKGVAQAVADAAGQTIIGGGDSAAAINQFNMADQMDFISTGGGASMELVEGKVLPGVAPML
ncbi:MAG: phosphoglycerate kinase [Eggerthellales bacterium]|nr:phosphoglycerate kinase [Eggerthellales bacterium]